MLSLEVCDKPRTAYKAAIVPKSIVLMEDADAGHTETTGRNTPELEQEIVEEQSKQQSATAVKEEAARDWGSQPLVCTMAACTKFEA